MKNLPVSAPHDYLVLTAIGLTKAQAQCYGLLAPGYGLSAAALAQRLGVSSTNLYRLLKDLKQKGFVTEIGIVPPTKYRAVPLTRALVTYADYQRQQVKGLIVLQEQNL